MNIEYKKDLRHNYMVISHNDEEGDAYCITMLEQQTMEGILPVQRKRMDDNSFLYYDITAKQSMTVLFDKTSLTYEEVRSLCMGILMTIERAYEYLLPEDNFILEPDFIYLEVVTHKPVLCFKPGYGKSITNQMVHLLEYLMNKVDYNDKEGVLLVYQLYAISKEEGYTFDHLMKALMNKESLKINLSKDKQGEDEIAGGKLPNAISNNIPVMVEKVEGEEEILCHSLKTYLITAACVLGSVAVLIFSLSSGILYNAYGNRMDFSKLFALLLILLCVDGYVLNKVWDKRNRITKLIPKREYIDPRQLMDQSNSLVLKKLLSSKMQPAKLKKEDTMEQFLKKDDTNQPEESYGSKLSFKNDNSGKANHRSQLIDNCKSTNKDNKVNTIYNLNNDYRQEYRINLQNKDYKDYKDNMHYKDNKNYKDNKDYRDDRNYKSSENYRGNDNFRDDEDYEDENPTCLLNANVIANHPEFGDGDSRMEHNSTQPKLTLLLNPVDNHQYQPIILNSIPFFIGKLKRNVDYCLEKDVVSRYHAKITKEDEQYYITDLNSTNGTFVNEEPLMTYQRRKIQFGDEVAFADIKYRFEATQNID